MPSKRTGPGNCLTQSRSVPSDASAGSATSTRGLVTERHSGALCAFRPHLPLQFFVLNLLQNGVASLAATGAPTTVQSRSAPGSRFLRQLVSERTAAIV